MVAGAERVVIRSSSESEAADEAEDIVREYTSSADRLGLSVQENKGTVCMCCSDKIKASSFLRDIAPVSSCGGAWKGRETSM